MKNMVSYTSLCYLAKPVSKARGQRQKRTVYKDRECSSILGDEIEITILAVNVRTDTLSNSHLLESRT